MPMTDTATMSSMTVSVSRRIRSCVDTAGPTRASTPSRKAVSVPITTPHPRASSPPGLIARKIAAGTSIPPMPATRGTASRLRSVSSPTASSRRTSRPITKKKTTISPSLTQWWRSIEIPRPPSSMLSSVCHRSS